MKTSSPPLLQSLRAGIIGLVGGLCMLVPTHAQQVPDRLNYQGMLRKGDGTPEPAGYKTIEFRIYDAPTAGTLQWARSHLVNLDSQGLFNVILMEGGSPITQGSPKYTDLTSVFTAADGQDRYLELTVAGSNPIQPRQRFVTAAYAFLAADVTQAQQNFTVMGSLTVHNSARVQSLTVDTGATLNDLTVTGNANLKKITPGTTLILDGDLEFGSSTYHHVLLGGGNSSGFLYGSYPKLGDGIHLGYNYYEDAAGVGHVRNAGGQTTRLSLGYGQIILATAGINTPPVNRVVLDQNGNLGVGTMTPAAKLDVYGTVKIKNQAPVVIRRYPLTAKDPSSDAPNYYDPSPAYSANDWSAAVIGFTCKGDFSQSTIGQLLDITTQKNAATGNWRVQFDVRHHSSLTDMVVDVMYIRKELVDDNR